MRGTRHVAIGLLFMALGAISCGTPAQQTVSPAPAISPVPQVKPPEIVGSCEKAMSHGVCTEHTPDTLAFGAELIKTACSLADGTFSPSPCASADRIGTCSIRAARTRVYYKPRWETPQAQADCEQNFTGEWTLISGDGGS